MICIWVSMVPLPSFAHDGRSLFPLTDHSSSTLAQPNVVDSRGCIRMCDKDTLPCDPPIYKHADGRCTYDY